ncbi:acetate--CoA ligase family protein [uncultured Nocardioides sp.]|uniref:Acetyl-CoA synthetase (ADP-forming) alpha chain n=1 Tax=uncultured Nocardioides sp. TaxID=198441 RepID=A0A6J4P368_9ACTN|nr:acetate--CoA ligase family protein [uncultured Nocardioides sp.]CAA9404915.1 MAG: Acetyl-CoA synthetase (ADP-forming) alpha chain [uncultured Nocardioides sp.]
MAHDREVVQEILDKALADGRTSLSAPEAKLVADAYGIPTPGEALATSGDEAATFSSEIGFPVVLKIVSPDILHKTDAGGVVVGVDSEDAAREAYDRILANAKAYQADADITGVQVQKMLVTGGDVQEVIVGAVTDPAFGKVVAFGLGGVLVEVLKDITFRLAPTTHDEAMSMVNGIGAAEILNGVRGAQAVDKEALTGIITGLSDLVNDFPQFSEVDLNPVLAGPDGATAVDVRIIVDREGGQEPVRFTQDEILASMNRIMKPKAIAVIGASNEDGKIGNSVMKNLINGGYRGSIFPINPKSDTVLDLPAYKSITDVPDDVDVAVFAVPAKFVAGALEQCGEKGVAGAILIPSGFAETGDQELQDEVVAVARKHGVRILGPNIYGYYYTPENLCATFCTPYDVKGSVALSSQSGGIGMAILGFSRSSKMGVSSIVGVGNKADIDEDDLLTFFESDDNTQLIAMHLEDLKDGRSFAEVASRVSQKKPVIVLKAGRTDMGARAASSHTGALAGNDKVYDDILKQSGVIRAPGLGHLLEFARGVPKLPTPKGENVLIITGAGGSGVLLSDAVVDNGMTLMDMPEDLAAKFDEYIPPFGASGNPVDITGGEPPSTYRNTIALGLEDDRIHSLILGYWHTIVTPPMVFAKLVAEVVEEYRAKGIEKPVVASLSGDVEVEEASTYLYERGVVAYPYNTELPVDVLGAKYRWARNAGTLGN